MQNSELVEDYLKRACARLKAIQVLADEKSYPDVVRESQEVVELCLKALLRFRNVQPPRIHDVSDVLEAHLSRFQPLTKEQIEKLSAISRDLRRDRELAYYGTEDLTPSKFYRKENADEANKAAHVVYDIVRDYVTSES